jgi:PIN domain nuclease of toxin-antitoxin system
MIHHLVVDTQSVLWYLGKSPDLSAKARDAMRGAIAAGGKIHVSAITIVELVYLTERGRIPIAALEKLEDRLRDPTSSFRLVPVDHQVARTTAQIPRDDVPDMPDRIVGATAVAMGIPLVTSDTALRRTPSVDTIW